MGETNIWGHLHKDENYIMVDGLPVVTEKVRKISSKTKYWQHLCLSNKKKKEQERAQSKRTRDHGGKLGLHDATDIRESKESEPCHVLQREVHQRQT